MVFGAYKQPKRLTAHSTEYQQKIGVTSTGDNLDECTGVELFTVAVQNQTKSGLSQRKQAPITVSDQKDNLTEGPLLWKARSQMLNSLFQ